MSTVGEVNAGEIEALVFNRWIQCDVVMRANYRISDHLTVYGHRLLAAAYCLVGTPVIWQLRAPS